MQQATHGGDGILGACAQCQGGRVAVKRGPGNTQDFVQHAEFFSNERQQKQIALLHDLFNNCRLDLDELHTGTIEQTLALLSQSVTEKQKILGMVLASLFPQSQSVDVVHDDAKPWRSIQAWPKTSDALAGGHQF
jgi:hypothetical protein